MKFVAYIGFIATLIAILISKIFEVKEINSFTWLILVVGIDVSHVYSSLFRTYLAERIHPKLKKILLLTPLICFVFAFLIALRGTAFFWSCLVYIAIFHFIRQQIGFLRILTDINFRKSKLQILNEIFIYLWTGGSVLIWHLQGSKNFHWFIENDLFYLKNFTEFKNPLIALVIFSFIIGFVLNLTLCFKKKISIHYLFLLISTFTSWFFAIVYFNSDFIFTFANVVAHGLPYMALVLRKEKNEKTIYGQVEVFISIVLFLALIEEALWDALIWREHSSFFESFYFLPQIVDHSILKSFVLALLILPQLTHYFLDGFIWKRKYSSS